MKPVKFGILWAFMLLALLSLAGTIFAVPYLEVTNTSTAPTTLYPGTQGYLSVVITNTGDTPTDSASITYSSVGGNAANTFQLGSLGAGSNTRMNIPITISTKTTNGMQLVDLTVAYTYSDASSPGSSTKAGENRLSIPLTVKQYDPVVVSNVAFGASAVSVGEKVPVSFDVYNKGGVVNNAHLSTPDNSSFYLDTESQEDVGSIPANSSIQVSLTLVTSSDTKAGTYGVPLVLSYQDQLNEEVDKTISIGPISVVESSTQCRLSLIPQSTVEVGSEVDFNLSITNAGSSSLSAMVNINSTSVFMPIGMQSVYFDSIPAHSTASKIVKIGVSSSASAGYYALPIQMTTIPGSSAVYNTGISVTATPDIKVSFSSSAGGSGQVQVTNTGNSQIRSVNVVITPKNSFGSSGSSASTESFIGTLNVDDYSTVPITSASSEMTVAITFRDSNNQLHTMVKTLSSSGSVTDVSSNSSGGSGTSSAGQSSSNSAFSRSSNRPGGMGLFGPGSNGSGGIDLTLLGGVVVVCVVGGYLTYRRFFARKAKANQGAEKSELK